MQKELIFKANLINLGFGMVEIVPKLKKYVKKKYNDKYFWDRIDTDGDVIKIFFKLKNKKNK